MMADENKLKKGSFKVRKFVYIFYLDYFGIKNGMVFMFLFLKKF
jgi:hypothetical protein